MLRRRLACFKHLSLAVLAIALLMGTVEIGLRVHHSLQVQNPTDPASHRTLSVPSWTMHHTLKPLRALTRQNPETNKPIWLRTNSFGLRGPEIQIPKPSGTYRVIYLGDDAVFAEAVAEEESFCRLVQERLESRPAARVEVINAGVPGYCPLLSYLQLKHSLLSLQPDLLILNFDVSDVADDHHYRRQARMGTHGVPVLCSHPDLQPARLRFASRPLERCLIFQFLKRQLGELPADADHPSDLDEIETPLGHYAWTREARPDWSLYLAQAFSSIGQIQELADQLACPFVVTTLPAPWQVAEEAMAGRGARERWGIAPGRVYDAQIAMRPLADYLQSRGIRAFDATPFFQAAADPQSLFLDHRPQLSSKGHQVFAAGVANFLIESLPRFESRMADRSAPRAPQ